MPVITENSKVISNISRLLKFCLLTGIPVITTEQEKLGDTVQEIRQGLPPHSIVPKVHFDSFSCEEFAHRIKKLRRKTLILAGVEAHICVAQTALNALPSYRVQVVSDAISSRTRDNRDVALERLRGAGVTVTSTEMFIYEILRKAGTDEFKAALPLVK